MTRLNRKSFVEISMRGIRDDTEAIRVQNLKESDLNKTKGLPERC